VLAVLCDAYDEEEVAGEQRTVLKLHPRLAPIKVAVLPLVRKDGQPELAHEVFELLRGRMQTEYDEGGSIGSRYRRQDEIGTPYCVTIDHQSLEDRTVTVRDRDTLEQERVAVDALPARPRRAPRRPLAGRRSSRKPEPPPWPSPRAVRLRCPTAIAVALGAALAMQSYVNGGWRSRSGRPELAAAVNNAVGLIALGAIATAIGAIPRALRAWSGVQPWYLLGDSAVRCT
jgi:hypothetical protein